MGLRAAQRRHARNEHPCEILVTVGQAPAHRCFCFMHDLPNVQVVAKCGFRWRVRGGRRLDTGSVSMDFVASSFPDAAEHMPHLALVERLGQDIVGAEIQHFRP